MQNFSNITVFDTVKMTKDHPFDPEGSLFTYYPDEKPEYVHYHDFLELGYCEGGSGIFIVDGKSIPFQGKCISIIYPGQIHIAKSISQNKSFWHFLYIDMYSLFFNFPAPLINSLKASNARNYSFPNIISKVENKNMYELVEAILNEAAKMQTNCIQIIQGMLYSLLTMHGRYMVQEMKGKLSKKESLLKELGKVINFISTNYMKPITIDDLEEVSSLSRATLERKFLEYAGKSPMQYIHELRLNQAAVMLIDNTSSIMDISFDVGYQTLSCFNRQFLKYYKMSPSEYRKKHIF